MEVRAQIALSGVDLLALVELVQARIQKGFLAVDMESQVRLTNLNSRKRHGPRHCIPAKRLMQELPSSVRRLEEVVLHSMDLLVYATMDLLWPKTVLVYSIGIVCGL